MNYSYRDGKIIVEDNYFSDAVYHVSNECISVIFDGKGAISSYAPANETDMLSSSVYLFRNNAPVDVYSRKTVEMLGRSQTVTVYSGEAELKIEQFLSASVNGVFTSYELKSDEKDDSVQVSLCINKSLHGFVINDKKVLTCENFRFGATAELDFVPLNKSIYFTVKSNKKVYTFISLGSAALMPNAILDNFENYERAMRDEIASVFIPENLTEEQKALYLSAYFCSLENYKCLGDYKAFMAGHRYLMPMRSYYRDSYYTVLPMFRGKIELVKNQILTLARGIIPVQFLEDSDPVFRRGYAR